MPRDDDDDDRPRKKPSRDEDDDRPRAKQRPARRDDEEEDEDRPRRRPRDDEEDYDEPRRRRRDEDDEDEPRSKRRDRRDDADDERPRRKRGTVEKIIPYHNGWALASYYCSFGSVIAVLGAVAIAFLTAPHGSRALFLSLDIGGGGGLGLLAIVFGILGLIKRNRNPDAGGTAHAIIGLVLGAVGGIGVVVAYILLQGFFIAAAIPGLPGR